MLIYEEKLNFTNKEKENDILFFTLRKRPKVKDPFDQGTKTLIIFN